MELSAQAQTANPRLNWRAISLVLLRITGVAVVVVLIPIAFNMEWRNFEKIFRSVTSLRFIALGLTATVIASLVAIITSLPLATGLALGRLSPFKVIRLPIVAFIEVVRAVPLVLLIFYINLRLPGLDVFQLMGIGNTE